ncbi:MAG: ribosome recycling factor [Candidatus Kerfeldbacteria bacterium]|nr:ribosome recycling factor [Candidatus Kerfeldbacteria bacterium]
MPTRPQFEAAINHLEQELLTIRTGRANPSMVESLSVEAYGSTMPLVQLASITVADARTIVIQPWDKNVLKDVERALQQADFGLTPVNDGTVIRLTVPALTEERRRAYLKIVNAKLEQARVAIRKIREEALKSLRENKQNGALSENSFFAQQKELQRRVDTYMEQISTLGSKKEHELMII